jgi:hypothetical protein
MQMNICLCTCMYIKEETVLNCVMLSDVDVNQCVHV